MAYCVRSASALALILTATGAVASDRSVVAKTATQSMPQT
jgi:hypothetical protein